MVPGSLAGVPGRYQFSLPDRRQRDGWFKLGSFDITTTALLVLLGVVSMFVYAASPDLLRDISFISPSVRDGELWRLITWPIPNPPTEIWVILTLAFFWFMGHRIEDQIGRKKFTVLILTMTVIPAAFVTIFDFTSDTGFAYGLGVLATGLLVVFALDNPSAVFFFGIPAWVIAAVFVGIDVLRLLGQELYGQLVLELAVIVVALVGARQYGLLQSMTLIPNFGRSGQRRQPRQRRAPAAAPRRAATASSVITGPWASSDTAVTDQIELDMLLDKIGASGMDSLSRDEKQRLNDLSKRLRGS